MLNGGFSESKSFTIVLDIPTKIFIYLLLYIYRGELDLCYICEKDLYLLLAYCNKFTMKALETMIDVHLKKRCVAKQVNESMKNEITELHKLVAMQEMKIMDLSFEVHILGEEKKE